MFSRRDGVLPNSVLFTLYITAFTDSLIHNIGAEKMAEKIKAKAKKYGKKSSRAGDLTSAFASLHVSDSPPHIFSSNAPSTAASVGPSAIGPPSTVPRPPLRTRSGNRERSPRQARQKPGPQKKVPQTSTAPITPSTYSKPLLDVTGQSKIEYFDHWAEAVGSGLQVMKVGDGSFADVYKFTPTAIPVTESVIGKLLPIRPDKKALCWNDMTTIEDAVTEIRLLEMVTDISGFVEFRGARVLYGPLPELIKAPTEDFNQRRRGFNVKSEYCGRRSAYPEDQLWLLIEMSDAGRDLDTLLQERKRNVLAKTKHPIGGEMRLDVRKTRDIFWATANALAHGEEYCSFEHRDLHLSNVCVRHNAETPDDSTYALVPSSSQLGVVLIDYTLSRAGDGKYTIYNPMKDKGIFTGEGDLQFDTYRHMRTAVRVNTRARWEKFVPLTNVLWLHHLLVNLLDDTHEPSKFDSPKPPEQRLWDSLSQLRDGTSPQKMAEGWKYRSASDLVAMGRIGKM